MRFTFGTAASVLLTTLLLGCVVMDAEYDDRFGRYERTAATALEREVIPKLLAALTPEQRRRLARVNAKATASLDSTRIALEHDERGRSTLMVSTGFLSLQDTLVDASVIASETTGYEQQLIDYSVMIARLALGPRGELKPHPEPFWQYIGWKAARYETFSSDPRFAALRERAMLQSLAWLAATLLTEHIYRELDAPTNLDSEQAVRQRTTDLLLRAQFAPVPAWPVAILFNAIQHPDANASDEWICGARDVLETSASVTEKRDLGTDGELSVDRRDAVLRRWRDASQVLERSATCDSPLNAAGTASSS